MKIGFYGFGSIGKTIARVALSRGHDVVSVVDVDERIVGRDVGEVLGVGSMGVKITKDVSELELADVVIHATGSYLDKTFNQIASVVRMGIDVVSTCETLAYPYYRYPILSIRLDQLARENGVVVIGTGINPGLLLDTLVVVVAASIPTVKGIRAVRSVDAARRRESFRRKIGVGEDPRIVLEKLSKGMITGHVGYAESVHLIALAGDLQLDKVVEGQEPVVAEENIDSGGVMVEKGLNKGIKGFGAGYVKEREVIKLEFHAYVGAPEFEEIEIIGEEHTVKWRSTGTHGDLGTAAVILNVAEKIRYLEPGLRLMTDLLPFKIRFSTK